MAVLDRERELDLLFFGQERLAADRFEVRS
jgi:hypothetical protein